jgi:hypothetical protein
MLYAFVQYLRTACTLALSGRQHKSCDVIDLGAMFGAGFSLLIWQCGCLRSCMTIKKKKEWRRLCKAVADEPDPRRLSQLADQLIEKLDARRRTLRRSKQRIHLGGKE